VKTIVLSIVVICALAVAGIGGTLAGWSDTEESMGNYISTGSLDLKVDHTDDLPWGDGLPVITEFEDIVPCSVYKSTIIVENEGQAVDPDGANMTAPLYIMFKDFACSNVSPTCGPGYEWPEESGIMKPEPELVTEYGGVLAQVNIMGDNVTGGEGNWSVGDTGFNATWPRLDATGRNGDVTCSMSSRIEVTLYFGPSAGSQSIVHGPVLLNTLLNEQIYLGELPQCGEDYLIGIWYHFKNTPADENWPQDHWPNKFADWKTNAWMKDRIDFNIMFELLDYNFTDAQRAS
jgi:predicted ribosomally synthesized peptide with SipW-like signal peptide